MSLPGKHDLTIYRGDGYTFSVKLTNESGEPMDVVDPIFAQWRRVKNSNTFENFTITPGTDPDSVVVSISGEQTTRMDENGVWDLEVRPSSGDPRTLLAGTVKIIRDVTRSETP